MHGVDALSKDICLVDSQILYHYFCRFTNHVVQTIQYSTGAANTAAPNLTKMPTLCHFFPCVFTNTIGAINTVPPKQWHNCIALVGCKEKGSVSSSITNHRIMPNNLAGN